MDDKSKDILCVRVRNCSSHALPSYASSGASGLDLRANLSAPLCLVPMARVLVPTGLHIALPVGFEAQVRSRSGLAYKEGIIVLNSPGTIDSDYRGELKILLINLSNVSVDILDGDRVAQLVITAYRSIVWQGVDELPSSMRQDGGFGSTGKQ